MFDIAIQVVYGALILFTPLVMSASTSELFEFNKMMIIYLAAVLVLSLWLGKMIRQKKIIFRRTLLDLPLLLFLIVLSISTLSSIDIHTSIFGYYGRFNGGLSSIIAYLVLYFGFVSNIPQSFVKKLLIWSLSVSSIVIAWGFPGHFGYDLSCLVFTGQFNNSCWTDQFRPAERMFSTLGQPNWLGAYLAIHLFIGLYFLFKNDERLTFSWKNIVLALYLVLNMSAILFTRSRSALLSVLLGLVLFFFFIFLRQWLKIKKITLDKRLLMLILVILVPIIVIRTGVEKVDSLLNGSFLTVTKMQPVKQSPIASPTADSITSTDVTESFDLRKIVWSGAVDLGKRYPFFGTGPETFAYSYYFVRPASHNLTSEWDFLYNKAHNEFLNYLATTGFGGLISYLLIIVVSLFLFIRQAYRTKSLLPVCAMLAYMTILFTNFFGFSTTTTNLFLFLLPAFTLVATEDGTIQPEATQKTKLTNKQILLFIALLFLPVGGMYYLSRYYSADMMYAKADTAVRQQSYQEGANYLSQALSLHYEHVYQDKLSNALANLAFIASYQKQDDTAKQLIKLSDFYNNESIKASQKNALYWKTRAKNNYLYYQIGLNKDYLLEAVRSLKNAAILAPTDPKINYSLSLMYSLYADETKDKDGKKIYQDLSLQEINKTISLKSNYADAYQLKAQLLKKYGQKAEAKQLYEFILKNFSPNDEAIKKEIQSL